MILQKPATYMNNSGIAVQEALRYFRVEPDHCLIIYDDVDLPAGQLRIRPMAGLEHTMAMRQSSVISAMNRFPSADRDRTRAVHYDMAEFVLFRHSAQQRD